MPKKLQITINLPGGKTINLQLLIPLTHRPTNYYFRALGWGSFYQGEGHSPFLNEELDLASHLKIQQTKFTIPRAVDFMEI